MDREIKFRGKLKSEDKWIYGFYYNTYVENKKIAVIIETYRTPKTHYTNGKLMSRSLEVFNESVGQYTGLKDKDGKDIYEGDILEYRDEDNIKEIHKVFWGDASFQCAGQYLEHLYLTTNWKIIGNIYENPELLEEK